MNILTLPLVVPQGWAEHTDVDGLRALLVFIAYPAGLFALIVLLVLLPRLIKGGASAGTESEWFGGPRKSGDELAGPDGEDSKAGGAGARW
ncbi:hypothetical protein [Nocardioides jejuensis]|uniref:Uncharacterized protein n=1 Tax=Nocardioides jejuensis TaxID=2502782 RepID=A0A4R1CFH2_9ACTN|nr:hypothetical protein [Nocardioides jejuensis]TCJ30054.1 hypothetical protein EPD65_05585 [Nocardioides jejuensis]